jgi:hypothetical protein
MLCNLLKGEAAIHDGVQHYETEYRVKFLPVLRLTSKVLAQKKKIYILRFADHNVRSEITNFDEVGVFQI